MSQRSEENQALYERGLAAFRAADWQGAIDAFEHVQRNEGSNPELDRLLSDAQLKRGFDHGDLPPVAATKPPRKLTLPRWRPIAITIAGIGVVALVSAFLLNRGIVPATAAAQVLQPLLAAVVEQGSAAAQTFSTQPVSGTLDLRWAEGQTAQVAAPNLEIILDASGSMLARAGEQRRIAVAQAALRSLVEQLPEQTNVALRTYGRRRSNDCSDSELVQPLGPLDRAGLIAQIESTQPVPEARTPLALSLKQAADDVSNAQGDVLILVVSDGNETCDGNPVQEVANLRAAHPNVRVSVVGFSVGPDEWRKQLQEAAAQGDGTYFDAATPEQLTAALTSAASVKVRVLASDGSEVSQGNIGTSIELPAGRYSIITDDKTQTRTEVEIHRQATTSMEAYQEQNGVLLRSTDQQQ